MSDFVRLSDNLWLYDGKLKAVPGSTIITVCAELVDLERTTGEMHSLDFNGVTVAAGPDTDPDALYNTWKAVMDARAKAYREDPQRLVEQEAARKAEAAQLQELDDLLGGAPEEPSWKNRALWQSWVDANRSGYGLAVINYALTWARLMEVALQHGESVGYSASRMSHLANTGSISGFQHGAARNMLRQAWKYGTDLPADA